MINGFTSLSNWSSAILTVGFIQVFFVFLLILIFSILKLKKTLIVAVALGFFCNIFGGSTWLFQVGWYIQFANYFTQLSLIPLGIVCFLEFAHHNGVLRPGWIFQRV